MESIKAYLKDIRHIPLLKPEEEIELTKKVKAGDKEARKKMIRSNLRLVINLAKRYMHLGIPFMDLIEEGNIGLMKAVDKFNPSRKLRFSTYAAWWIKQGIGRAISDQGKLIRVPVYMNDMIIKLKKNKQLLTQKLGRSPLIGELAKCLDLPVDKVRQIKSWTTKMSSLDTPIGEDGENEVIDMIEDPATDIPNVELSKEMDKERIDSLLDRMTDREKDVLDMRFGLTDGIPQTLASIAKKLSLSRERIRQIEKVALRKLRRFTKLQKNEPR